MVLNLRIRFKNLLALLIQSVILKSNFSFEKVEMYEQINPLFIHRFEKNYYSFRYDLLS